MLTHAVNAETYTGAILLARRAEIGRLTHSVAVSRYNAAMSKPRPIIGGIMPVAPAPLIVAEKSVIVKERFQTAETPLAKDSKPRAAKAPKPKVESVPEVSADAVWVSHTKFGKGLILSQGDGKITVSFEDGATRTLLVKLANLEKVA